MSAAPTDARDKAFLDTMQQSPNKAPAWARRRLEEIGEELAILEGDAISAPRGLIDALKQERKLILDATGGK
jgi:hypothetical protein